MEQATVNTPEVTDSNVTAHETAEAARRRAARTVAIQIGLRAGLALAGLNLVNWLAGLAAGGALADSGASGDFISPSVRGFATLATGLLFIARVALFFLAGYWTARRTSSEPWGALAGLVAGVVDGVGGMVATLLGAALFPMYTLTAGYTSGVQPVGDVLLNPLAWLLALGMVGLLLGSMGGGAWAGTDGMTAARR